MTEDTAEFFFFWTKYIKQYYGDIGNVWNQK